MSPLRRVRNASSRARLALLGVCTSFLLAASVRAEAPFGDEAAVGEAALSSPLYAVRRGDTVGALASRLGTSTDELVRLNPGLDPNRIREGQVLRLEAEGRRVDHSVKPGEVLSRIAAHYEVSRAELRRWNPKLDPDRLRAGQTLIVYTRVPDSRSQSIGTPTTGRLSFASRLPAHPGYLLRDPERAWGTSETIADIVAAFDALRALHPRAPRVRVHDLSLREGGRISDHHSHQSGRDVDLTYFQKQCEGACSLRRVSPSELDVERQWALIEHWLKRGRAEAIFIDYALQAKLYAHARVQGVSRELLLHWFQYPRGRGTPAGILRHAPNHADHLHVRFVCDQSDPECRMFRVSPVQGSHAVAVKH